MPSNCSRRDLLKLAVGSAGVALLPPARAEQAASRPADGPLNIIFMVSDGMSMGTLALAEAFAQRVLGRGTLWSELLSNPHCSHGWLEMGSLDSLVTDSAAASSSWATGTRIFNNAVNVLPDGTRLTPIAQLAQDIRKRVGLVTTTTITHATPAGFAAIEENRDNQAAIAPQYLGRVDVLMGGGREFFAPTLRPDQRDLIGEYRAAGYTLWTSADQVNANDPPPAKILGVFGSGHLPFSIDVRDRAETAPPSLAAMTKAALASLSASPNGFLLQVEGGRVDHAAHNNDAGALLWDQIAFDDAIRVALEFAQRRSDTLMIITTDHGNANPGLNGMGKNYHDSTTTFERLLSAQGSYEAMQRSLAGAMDGGGSQGAVRDLIEAKLKIQISEPEAAAIVAALRGAPPPTLNRQFANSVGVLGQILSNYTGIGWTGVSHTADWALLTALGPGAAGLAGVHANTYVYEWITGLWEIRHRNPRLTPEEARRFAHRSRGLAATWA